MYPSIIDAAERDAEVAALQVAWHRSLMTPFDAVVERAKRTGQMAAERLGSDLVAATTGPLFYPPLDLEGAARRPFRGRGRGLPRSAPPPVGDHGNRPRGRVAGIDVGRVAVQPQSLAGFVKARNR